MEAGSKWAYYEEAALERAAAWKALEDVRASSAETLRALEDRYSKALDAFKLARIAAYKEKTIDW